MTQSTMARLPDTQKEKIAADDWISPDLAALDEWTEATGIDLAVRTVARLLELNEDGEREVEVYCFEGGEWERGEDAKYGHRDRTTQGVTFSHSRVPRTLEIRADVDHAAIRDALVRGDDWSQISILIQADRLGQNGQIRNARVTLGYRVGGEHGDATFLPCDNSPNARSVAIYSALGAAAQADEMQIEIDTIAR